MEVRLIQSLLPALVLSIALVSCTGEDKKEVETFRLAPTQKERDKPEKPPAGPGKPTLPPGGGQPESDPGSDAGDLPRPPSTGPQTGPTGSPDSPPIPRDPNRPERPALLPPQVVTQNYSAALGQRNLGNTCFANSVHKLFLADGRFSNPALATQPLQREFFSFLQKMEIQKRSLLLDPGKTPSQTNFFEGELRSFFTNVTNELWAKSNAPDLSFFYPSVLMRDQVDGFDYYQKLVEILELPKISPGFYWSTQVRFRSGDLNQSVHSLDELFAVELGMESPRVQSVQDALTLSALPTEMSGPNLVINEKTGAKEISDKFEFLTLAPGKTAPTQIVLALKRFQMLSPWQKFKVTRPVEPSPSLKVDFFSRDQATQGSEEYKLKAVVVQMGSLNAGHYIAYTLQTPGDLNGTWILHDDVYVSPVAEQDKAAMLDRVRTEGYLFLYGK